VYRLTDDLAAVLTIDVLTPIVDDPYDFGRIAAANALSDVFAMGATAACAMNFLALDSSLGTDVAREILRGGSEAVNEAGAVLVGGHTIDDNEPKYGLAVFGTVHPDHIVRNAGAKPGDVLYLTKPLGTGLLSAAAKIGEIDQAAFQCAIDSMKELNLAGEKALLAAEAHAATDVTGFGLAGHLHEMIQDSGLGVELDWGSIPMFDGAWELSCDYCRPNRTFSIMDFAAPFVAKGNLDDEEFDNRMGVICDPQTSGGLLVAVAPENAETFEQTFGREAGRAPARIGTFVEDSTCTIRFAD
jgi:selenide,water dikinase